MTRVVRNAALLCVGGVLVASAVFASAPCPQCSTIGTTLDVEGTVRAAHGSLPDNCNDASSGFANHCGDITVTVRDALNAPINGCTVILDFAACSDRQLSCTQNPGGVIPGQTYQNPSRVFNTTNAAGQVTFKVQGASNSNTVANGSPYVSPGVFLGTACVAVYGNNGNGDILLGNLKAQYYDIDGNGSVTGNDGATVAAENVRMNAPINAQKMQRTDLDHNGAITGNDASFMSQMVIQANATFDTGSFDTKHGAYCP